MLKPNSLEIGNVIRLRELRPEDKEKIRNWRNKPTVAEYMYSDHYVTKEEHNHWFQKITTDPTCKYWIIVYEGHDVGLVCLYQIDVHNKRCHWAFYIAEEGLRGKGIGGFVEYSILCYVFDELRFNKLCCEVLVFNKPVVNLHKSFGFKEEGFFRQHILKAGQMMDIYCLAILRDEWEQQKPLIEERLKALQTRQMRISERR